jgi:two-component system, LytTR family, sensor kinase
MKSIANFFTNRVSRNLLFWLVFASLHVNPRDHFQSYLIMLAFSVVFYGVPVYINNLLLIPNYLVKRRFLAYCAIFLPLFSFTVIETSLLNRWCNSFLSPNTAVNQMTPPGGMEMAHILPILLLFTAMGFSKMLNDAIRHQRELERQIEQRLKAELEQLQSQINPHFLFNALNTIYGMARRTDEQTANAILNLSDILRHSLYEAGKEVISMTQEVTVLRQYIAFSRLRLHQKDKVQFSVELEDGQQNIAPFLLLPFIENAFKHGLNTDDECLSQIDIGLRLSGNELSFTCANGYSANMLQKSQGIGMTNVRRRLELFYPGRHYLQVDPDHEKYRVSLKIQLS